MNSLKYRVLQTLLVCLLLQPFSSGAIDTIVTGDWTDLSITADDLAAGPGSALNGTYESPVGLVKIDVVNTAGNSDTWRVDVRRTDFTWSGTTSLAVKRHDDGAGAGTISGGLGYQTISTTDLSFFSGSGDRTGINIQLRISNLSLELSPGNFSTTITYTVVDT